jgi:hypothetical protein
MRDSSPAGLYFVGVALGPALAPARVRELLGFDSHTIAQDMPPSAVIDIASPQAGSLGGTAQRCDEGTVREYARGHARPRSVSRPWGFPAFCGIFVGVASPACPRFPTCCSMVRRGSTVRVRQRALQKARKPGLFLFGRLAGFPSCGRYGALNGAFRRETCGARDPFAPRRPRRGAVGRAWRKCTRRDVTRCATSPSHDSRVAPYRRQSEASSTRSRAPAQKKHDHAAACVGAAPKRRTCAT